MKIEKNKIVFGSILLIVLIFIVAYSTLVILGDEDNLETLENPAVPELVEEGETYDSKLDALNDLKEERERQVPSIYSEELLDSLGVYDPLLEEEEKQWAIDSVYANGPFDYDEPKYSQPEEEYGYEGSKPDTNSAVAEVESPDLPDRSDFFQAVPVQVTLNKNIPEVGKELGFLAEVNGNQKVRANDRLELILMEDVEIKGEHFPKYTRIYGFVSLQPNRLHLKITHVGNIPVKLRAYDLQDGNEGIYIKNTFRAEARTEVIDDIAQDINIAGLPQLNGVTKIFRRNNRNIKVSVLNQYRLILKPQP